MPAMDLGAVARMTERQQLRYLIELTAEAQPPDPQPHEPKPRALQETSGNVPQQRSESKTEVLSVDPSECGAVYCDGAAVELLRGADRVTESQRNRLKAFKAIADALLPSMRRDAHLHHLVFSKSSHNLLLTRPSSDTQLDGRDGTANPNPADEATVCGGATFRMFRHADVLVLDVLVLVVAQQEGVCRRGYGTAMSEALKAVLAREAKRRGLRRVTLLTQADNGAKASSFWQKQQLRHTLAAEQLLQALHSSLPKLVGVYDSSTAMSWELLGHQRQAAKSTDCGAAQRKLERKPGRKANDARRRCDLRSPGTLRSPALRSPETPSAEARPSVLRDGCAELPAELAALSLANNDS